MSAFAVKSPAPINYNNNKQHSVKKEIELAQDLWRTSVYVDAFTTSMARCDLDLWL